eukprot:scaffold2441_cov413-Prasinococcus_capsulatus_cf.AAC.4
MAGNTASCDRFAYATTMTVPPNTTAAALRKRLKLVLTWAYSLQQTQTALPIVVAMVSWAAGCTRARPCSPLLMADAAARRRLATSRTSIKTWCTCSLA